LKGFRVWCEGRGQTLAEVVEVALAVGAAAVARADAGHGLGDEGPTAARQRESRVTATAAALPAGASV
jgi:hypothetical protein